MDFIFEALQYIADVFVALKDFVVSVPDFVQEIFAYAWFWAIKFYIYLQIEMIEFAYSVTSMLLKEYEVYTVLNMVFNQLSPDIRHAAFQLGIVDAIRIIIDALATAFVLRIMGW
ncbi:hypothetical protein OTK51_07855 [Vibrio scophthalmi]|uniref:hypothetical protein n=1 Tax=Vibrio scophthalmi TaxID=45658 RepID=UPI002284B409|nr:hypothetical protein [Vibrio scophthalmi]MCY9803346.1 hypothetical protein [Vibrio scophthalmi]